MALRWPTKSFIVCQPFWFPRSTICAVGPELFMACAETTYWPSGDQSSRSTCVVPPHYIMHSQTLRRQSINSVGLGKSRVLQHCTGFQCKRVMFKTAVLVWRCLNGTVPGYLSELCVPVAPASGRQHLRSALTGLLQVPRARTMIGRQSFTVMVGCCARFNVRLDTFRGRDQIE